MTIAEFDHLNNEKKREILQKCCGSSVWIEKMLTIPPAEDLIDLFEDAEEKWYECNEEDWKEAFLHHPKIGDINSLKEKFASTADFVEDEQLSVKETSEKVLESLAESNRAYEKKFGYIFIVSASGKSAEEMLGILTARLNNNPEEEIQIAMEEQNKITRLRLEKFFNS
jgi:2-oxo-4-hydroxy-4-carboxy-5-ureidoimidazoline decarboxylase